MVRMSFFMCSFLASNFHTKEDNLYWLVYDQHELLGKKFPISAMQKRALQVRDMQIR